MQQTKKPSCRKNLSFGSSAIFDAKTRHFPPPPREGFGFIDKISSQLLAGYHHYVARQGTRLTIVCFFAKSERLPSPTNLISHPLDKSLMSGILSSRPFRRTEHRSTK
jgi:hypothetical protein